MNRGFCIMICVLAVLGPVSAQQPGAVVNPKKAMADAHAARSAGRDADALKLYEAVVANQSRDAAKYKPDALYGIAILQLSTDTTDTAPAVTALNEAIKSYPTSDHRQEAAVVLRMLQRVDELTKRADKADEEKKASQESLTAKTAAAATYQERIAALTSDLDAARSQIDSGKSDSARASRSQTALQSENRTLKAELARLQAELEKKDQALRKIAGTIVK
jgi:chromosome segregation ATPase